MSRMDAMVEGQLCHSDALPAPDKPDKANFAEAIAQRLRATKIKLQCVEGAVSVLQAIQATWSDTSEIAKAPMEVAGVLAGVYDEVRKLASKDELAKRCRIEIAEALVLCCANGVDYRDRSTMLDAFARAFDKEVDETVLSQLLQAYYRSLSEVPDAFPSNKRKKLQSRLRYRSSGHALRKYPHSRGCTAGTSTETWKKTAGTEAWWWVPWW